MSGNTPAPWAKWLVDMDVVLGAVDGGRHQVAEVIRNSDVDALCALVGEELLARCPHLPVTTRPIQVQYFLTSGRDRAGFLVGVSNGVASWKAAESEHPGVVIRQHLADLLVGLFSNGCEPAGPAPKVEWHTDDLLLRRTVAILLRAADPGHQEPLSDIAVTSGADKWRVQGYIAHYERHLEPFRQARVGVLEIGVGGYKEHTGGESLGMWRRYFRRGHIFGLDVYDKTVLNDHRVTVFRGSQGDQAVLDDIARQITELSVVIDDGSHVASDVLTCFAGLFPHLAPSGLYIIEDIHIPSYWTGYGGNPDDTTDPTTVSGFAKALVDGLHFQERHRPPSLLDRTVTAMHCYHKMIIIEKGLNHDDPTPPWVPREPDPRYIPRPERW